MVVPVDAEPDLVVALGGNARLAARLRRVALVAHPVHGAVVALLLDVDEPSKVKIHGAAAVHHVAEGDRVPHLGKWSAIS